MAGGGPQRAGARPASEGNSRTEAQGGRSRRSAPQGRGTGRTAGRGAGRGQGRAGAVEAEAALIRISDLAGRPRGTGFLADAHGTLVTSHEAVDGLSRLVLHAPGDETFLIEADAIKALPEFDLAFVRTEGLTVPPLPVAARLAVAAGTPVRLRGRDWLDAEVTGTVTAVTYTATDRFHLLGEALELAVDATESDALRLGAQVTGGPVLDAETGAVLAVLGTALHSGREADGYAVPLRTLAALDHGGPLAALLARNAATVPAYGRDLNLAGALQLTGTTVGSASGARAWREPVERPDTAEEFRAFLDPPLDPEGADRVLGLVGDPGSGRTTELSALAARRARGAEPAPTVWLRGADLRVGDESVADAVARALRSAGRIVAASVGTTSAVDAALPGADGRDASPEEVAYLAREAGRPLLVLLDGPEEMPPLLAHRLADWAEGTAQWLREAGARLVLACRREFWEEGGALFPEAALYAPRGRSREAEEADRWRAARPGDHPGRALPPCVRLGPLPARQAARARARYGIPDDALSPADADHPLALRLLAEVRAALPDARPEQQEAAGAAAEAAPDDGIPEAGRDAACEPVGPRPAAPGGPPGRADVFGAHLDLMCLRIAVRLAAVERPPLRGTAVRRLAARVAGQVHEAARRCLGPGQGELDRESFEEVFPWRSGWASAVLTEGLLVPAGAGYRFAHEEFADWLQGVHLDPDAALHALVHRWVEADEESGEGQDPPVRLPSRAGGPAVPGLGGHVPPPPAPSATPLPVPRYRIGPVVQSLLLLGRQAGPAALARRLDGLVEAVDSLAARAPAPDGASGALPESGEHALSEGPAVRGEGPAVRSEGAAVRGEAEWDGAVRSPAGPEDTGPGAPPDGGAAGGGWPSDVVAPAGAAEEGEPVPDWPDETAPDPGAPAPYGRHPYDLPYDALSYDPLTGEPRTPAGGPPAPGEPGADTGSRQAVGAAEDGAEAPWAGAADWTGPAPLWSQEPPDPARAYRAVGDDHPKPFAAWTDDPDDPDEAPESDAGPGQAVATASWWSAPAEATTSYVACRAPIEAGPPGGSGGEDSGGAGSGGPAAAAAPELELPEDTEEIGEPWFLRRTGPSPLELPAPRAGADGGEGPGGPPEAYGTDPDACFDQYGRTPHGPDASHDTDAPHDADASHGPDAADASELTDGPEPADGPSEQDVSERPARPGSVAAAAVPRPGRSPARRRRRGEVSPYWSASSTASVATLPGCRRGDDLRTVRMDGGRGPSRSAAPGSVPAPRTAGARRGPAPAAGERSPALPESAGPRLDSGATDGPSPSPGERSAHWWASHLLGEVLLRVPDAGAYLGVLRRLAERITARAAAVGGFERVGLDDFGPWFWTRLALEPEDRLELLRLLLPADGSPSGGQQQ
ncbi:trypsin-like peptidase domain-containing protein, partial [Streptomyces sp. URMC 123]|uniref:trypsin-like peptidase domain-containing protein n=1 Tax=Streptomyces sp. URMC 123 TaxID=3423403 RepID=UPI003F1C6D10